MGEDGSITGSARETSTNSLSNVTSPYASIVSNEQNTVIQITNGKSSKSGCKLTILNREINMQQRTLRNLQGQGDGDLECQINKNC